MFFIYFWSFTVILCCVCVVVVLRFFEIAEERRACILHVVSIVLYSAIALTTLSYCLIVHNMTPSPHILRNGYNKTLILNNEIPGKPTRTASAKGFSPHIYEIGIENYGDMGNCKGIVFFIKEKYRIRKPSKIILSDKDKLLIYPAPISFEEALEGKLRPNNFTWEEIVGKRYDGIPIYALDQKEIIEQICDLQKESKFKHKTIFSLLPEEKNPLALYQVAAQSSIYSKIDVDWISSRIDKNELVPIALNNGHFIGHALLCYKVTAYENNTWRLYVLDPNIVYSRYPEHHPEEQTYITIGYIDGKQYYSYNPCLNGIYIYQNRYNSFVPGATFSWD